MSRRGPRALAPPPVGRLGSPGPVERRPGGPRRGSPGRGPGPGPGSSWLGGPGPGQGLVGASAAARGLALALFAAAAASGAAAAAQPSEARRVRVEGVAAFVGGSSVGAGTLTILVSDVALSARINLAGESRRLPTGSLPEPLLAATLEELIGNALIAREADRLRAAEPTESEIAEARTRLARRAGGAARLAALLDAIGAAPEELDALARRRAYVDAFLRANLEGTTVVSDAQVQRVFESGEHPFAGRPLEDVREVLRAWIAQALLRRDVERWIEVLRSRTEVRTLVRWSDGQG